MAALGDEASGGLEGCCGRRLLDHQRVIKVEKQGSPHGSHAIHCGSVSVIDLGVLKGSSIWRRVCPARSQSRGGASCGSRTPTDTPGRSLGSAPAVASLSSSTRKRTRPHTSCRAG